MKRRHERMRSFNKRVLNPIMLKFAGKTRGPFAVVRHQGRRSGKSYRTPIIVEPASDGFVIALTYGPDVDWLRNIQAAGRATILWHGKQYAINKPAPIDVETGLAAFPPPFNRILRMNRTLDFVKAKFL